MDYDTFSFAFCSPLTIWIVCASGCLTVHITFSVLTPLLLFASLFSIQYDKLFKKYSNVDDNNLALPGRAELHVETLLWVVLYFLTYLIS